jgi:methyltransferase (TIGR00027 family)
MQTVANVTGTAFVVAEFRADENHVPQPLYRDPVVTMFLNEHTREAAERIGTVFPPVKKMVRLRTRYLDDRLERQLDHGCQQVVIMGAGLDTRAVRKQSPGVRYFEIDDPETLSYKEAQLVKHGVQGNVVFIPGTYVSDRLVDLLVRNGVDFDRPIHFIWEGNTMYLPREAVCAVMADIVSHAREFTLSFDYMTQAVIAHTTGDPNVSTLVESFERMGAPWICGIDDLENFAEQADMQVIDNVTTSELHRTYWPDESIDSPIYEHYRLCSLRGMH